MIGAVIHLQAPMRQDCLFGPGWIGCLRTVIHLNVYILVISAYTDKQSKIVRKQFARKTEIRNLNKWKLIERLDFHGVLYSFIWSSGLWHQAVLVGEYRTRVSEELGTYVCRFGVQPWT
jgi:hypothetical protein